jgi:hypothetical protein
MTATGAFYQWFFDGVNGLGGWFLFALVAIAAMIWLYYNSSSRRLPAQGWKLAIAITAALLLPAAIYRFASVETRDSLTRFTEAIFYLGLLGGLIPVVIAVGYFFNFQGMVACREGHLYEQELGECPECASRAPVGPTPMYREPMQPYREPAPMPPPGPPPDTRPRANAWLIASDGRNYQLYLGTTGIGRSGRNDIQLIGDTTISREHVKIIEQNGRFKLMDVAGKNTTKVNGRIVRQPVLLEHDDRIQLGDSMQLQFITSMR